MKTLEERFWSKVDVREENECWEWTASIRGDGYGQITRGERGKGMESSHKVSWMIHYGQIPKGLHVLHKCDNKLCVNPNHLFLGTNLDNIRDKVRKGRSVRGSDVKTSVLKVEDVRAIRSIYIPWDRNNSVSALAKKFGVSNGTILKVVRRSTWDWVD